MRRSVVHTLTLILLATSAAPRAQAPPVNQLVPPATARRPR